MAEFKVWGEMMSGFYQSLIILLRRNKKVEKTNNTNIISDIPKEGINVIVRYGNYYKNITFTKRILENWQLSKQKFIGTEILKIWNQLKNMDK